MNDAPSPPAAAGTIKRRYTIPIAAPPARVWRELLDLEPYQRWTAAFHPGSTYEGRWALGEKIRFLSPSGDGMVAEIAELELHRSVSIRHLGFVAQGVEDTTSEAVRAWAPAYEDYTLEPVDAGTHLVIDIDVAPAWLDHMDALWPRALEALRAGCEG
jgi:hypothetical protein